MILESLYYALLLSFNEWDECFSLVVFAPPFGRVVLASHRTCAPPAAADAPRSARALD
jgi:hypothetical protein